MSLERKRATKDFININLWFNNFGERYQIGNADYYLLFGLYPEYSNAKNIKSKKVFWKSVILCFSENEMFDLLKSIKKTKNNKVDRFFDICFDDPNEVFGSRGFNGDIDLSQFLLDKKLSSMLEKL